jgi:hypothetical protein
VEGWCRRCSASMGANDGLRFGDAWSCGLRMASLKEEGGARATRWSVAWGGAMTASHWCGGEKSRAAAKE